MDLASKRLLQLLAFHATDVRYHELAEKITRFGIRQDNGRALTQTLIRSFLAKWEEQGLLIRSSKKPKPALMDTLVREGLSGDNSHQLLELARTTDRWSGRDAVLAFYIAFSRMILAGTIEEKILELYATKRDLAGSLLEGTDRSGKLTTEELLRLIKT